jgi:hypothetical protein
LPGFDPHKNVIGPLLGSHSRCLWLALSLGLDGTIFLPGPIEASGRTGSRPEPRSPGRPCADRHTANGARLPGSYDGSHYLQPTAGVIGQHDPLLVALVLFFFLIFFVFFFFVIFFAVSVNLVTREVSVLSWAVRSFEPSEPFVWLMSSTCCLRK